MANTNLEVAIMPGIPPEDRHAIEDSLLEAGMDVVGGGGFLDGSLTDISVVVADVAEYLPQIMAILQAAKVGKESYVDQSNPDERKYPVYEKLPTDLRSATKPWWKFW